MIVLDIIRHLFMSIICEFLDLLEIPVLIDFNWHCNLAFSCIASLITNFIEISLPHTLSNSLSVEELTS